MSKRLLFYKVMEYPIPQPEEYFYYTKKVNIKEKKTDCLQGSTSPLTKEYVNHIKKYTRLFKSIPRIQEIYLCNSISFNATHPKSDIDVFIVAKSWYMRRARFWSVFLFFLFGQKRSRNCFIKKFCLSFFVTDDHKNIFPLAEKEDVYLIYWLAHLIPLYLETKSLQNSIYKENTWIQKFLPNHPGTHCINIDIPITTGKSLFKKLIEKLTNWHIGKRIQKVIKRSRLPIMLYKKHKLWNKWKQIVISDKVCRFYADKRLVYNTLFKKHAKKSQR